MTTWTVTFYPFNILELGTVTVTGDADAGYPESRLYDRARSLYWKDTVTEAKTFTVDQGSDILEIDSLMILGHNFDGCDMELQYSTDNFVADINTAFGQSWTQDGNDDIYRGFYPAQTKRYWRVTLSSIANPQCGEIIITNGYQFNVLRDGKHEGVDRPAVQWNRTAGGLERSTKFGENRRTRKYSFWLTESEYTSFETVLSYLDNYSKPFMFSDHEGSAYMARFLEEPRIYFNHNERTRVDVSLIEQL